MRHLWIAAALASAVAIYLLGPWIAAALSQIVAGTIEISGVFRSQSQNASQNARLVPPKIYIDLGLIDSSGERLIDNIAKLVVSNNTSIIVKPRFVHVNVSGNLEIVGGAELILTSLRGDGTVYVYRIPMPFYRILMPCSISTGECIIPLLAILGYDEPLGIRAGEYSVSVRLSWELRGNGEIRAGLSIDIVEVPQET